tara:strand:- start:161 stop:289 length:129 start_codon:yes stop_codon:yes gene_type:complete
MAKSGDLINRIRIHFISKDTIAGSGDSNTRLCHRDIKRKLVI